MKKYYRKDDTTNENDLQRVYNYPIFHRDLKLYSVKDLFI